ncbi:MAG TPA: hypothetical protein VH592_14045 [Gemmataceae bacterium]|jgi:hypothetical protein
MDAIREAIEIAQIMAATKTTAGVGRLLRLLENVQERFFLDTDDVADLAEGDTAAMPLWFDDEPPFPAA